MNRTYKNQYTSRFSYLFLTIRRVKHHSLAKKNIKNTKKWVKNKLKLTESDIHQNKVAKSGGKE